MCVYRIYSPCIVRKLVITKRDYIGASRYAYVYLCMHVDREPAYGVSLFWVVRDEGACEIMFVSGSEAAHL